VIQPVSYHQPAAYTTYSQPAVAYHQPAVAVAQPALALQKTYVQAPQVLTKTISAPTIVSKQVDDYDVSVIYSTDEIL
jgi:hypothetical protein